ncbi:uncharacterized protein V6R79_012300 [Siganus canaliculatus]
MHFPQHTMLALTHIYICTHTHTHICTHQQTPSLFFFFFFFSVQYIHVMSHLQMLSLLFSPKLALSSSFARQLVVSESSFLPKLLYVSGLARTLAAGSGTLHLAHKPFTWAVQ